MLVVMFWVFGLVWFMFVDVFDGGYWLFILVVCFLFTFFGVCLGCGIVVFIWISVLFVA